MRGDTRGVSLLSHVCFKDSRGSIALRTHIVYVDGARRLCIFCFDDDRSSMMLDDDDDDHGVMEQQGKCA